MEFHYPLEIAKLILSRETAKKEAAQQAQVVWEKRLAFVDLKRKFPTLNDKVDEELLVDKERPVKRLEATYVFGFLQTLILSFIHCRRVPGLKIKTNDSPRSEPLIRPKDRVAAIREQIETTLERQKAIDHHWEDLVDVSPLFPDLSTWAYSFVESLSNILCPLCLQTF